VRIKYNKRCYLCGNIKKRLFETNGYDNNKLVCDDCLEEFYKQKNIIFSDEKTKKTNKKTINKK